MLLISADVKVALGILALNKYKQRRSITVNEYNLFTEYLHLKYDFIDETVYEDTRLALEKYFDEINLDRGFKVYRLKPMISIEELRKEYSFFPIKFLKIVFNPDSVLNLNDLTHEEEDSLEEFRRIDEKYQLKTILEICNLEKKKREAQERLMLINSNSKVVVNEDKVRNILESNRDISENDLVDKYYR